MPAPLRALILIRLSRMTMATTSPERQLADCRDHIARSGMVEVGIAEDLDVSGSVNALDRTGSGPWLRDRLTEFDVVIASKVDRFGRSTRHVHGLFSYLSARGKSLATADGALSTKGPAGELILFVLAWAAQMELDAIRARNTDAAQYNIRAGKYRGGVVPAGYRAEKDGDEWRLLPDEEGLAPVIRGIFADVIAGKRISAIVADLNERGIPTAKDRQAELNGREPSGKRWSVSNLRRMLVAPATIGQTVHRPLILDEEQKPKIGEDGQKVTGPEQLLFGPDGAPVQRAEPLIDPSDFRKVGRILDDRREADPKQKRAVEPSLLLQVLFCGLCGAPLYRLKGGKGRQPRYRCSSVQRGTSCGSLSPTQASADQAMTDHLLGMLGDYAFAAREYVPGSDPTAELEAIDAQLASLGAAVSRFPVGSPALDGLLSQVDTLSTRRAELASQPISDGAWRFVATGETFREHWDTLDSAGRNDLLREHNVRMTYARTAELGTVSRIEFGDLHALIRAVNPDAVTDVSSYPESTGTVRRVYPNALTERNPR